MSEHNTFRVDPDYDGPWPPALDEEDVAVAQYAPTHEEDYDAEDYAVTLTCSSTRVIGSVSDPTQIGCDLPSGHEGDHLQRDAYGPDSADLWWNRHDVRVRS